MDKTHASVDQVSRVPLQLAVNPYPAIHDYCRFLSVLLVDQINVILNELCVQTSRFANMCA